MDLLADIEAGWILWMKTFNSLLTKRFAINWFTRIEVIADAGKKLTLRRRSEAHVKAVLRGEPNAGKSSLMNALCAEEAAIVSDEQAPREIPFGAISAVTKFGSV